MNILSSIKRVEEPKVTVVESSLQQASLRPLASSVAPSPLIPPRDAAPSPPARPRRLLAMSAIAVTLIGVGAAGFHHAHSAPHTKRPTVETAFGNAAVRQTPDGVNERWATGEAPKFVLDPSLLKIDGQANEAVMRAFETWDEAHVNVPKATFVTTSSQGAAVQDGVSRILYAPITVSGMEDVLAITIGYADTSTGEVTEADMIFNSKYPFAILDGALATTACNGRFDLQNVATHEAGHVYGLGEDRDNVATTMYVSSELCETHKRVLSTVDTGVMKTLYAGYESATDASDAGGCGKATIAKHDDARDDAAWAIIGLGVIAVFGRRARRGHPIG